MHLIRFFLRPSSRAPAVERIESATGVLQARREVLRGVARRHEAPRGVARRRRFATRCADPVVKRRREGCAFPSFVCHSIVYLVIDSRIPSNSASEMHV